MCPPFSHVKGLDTKLFATAWLGTNKRDPGQLERENMRTLQDTCHFYYFYHKEIVPQNIPAELRHMHAGNQRFSDPQRKKKEKLRL